MISVLWFVLSGCSLFVFGDEHQDRLDALSLDTGADDSGAVSRSPFAGTYSGVLNMDCGLPDQISCISQLSVLIEDDDQISAEDGACLVLGDGGLFIPLEGFIGEIDPRSDLADGTVLVDGQVLGWAGRMGFSGDDRLLVGEGNGLVVFEDTTYECAIIFNLDD